MSYWDFWWGLIIGSSLKEEECTKKDKNNGQEDENICTVVAVIIFVIVPIMAAGYNIGRIIYGINLVKWGMAIIGIIPFGYVLTFLFGALCAIFNIKDDDIEAFGIFYSIVIGYVLPKILVNFSIWQHSEVLNFYIKVYETVISGICKWLFSE